MHYLIGKIPKIYLEIVILVLFIGTVIFFVSKDLNNQAFLEQSFFAFAIIRILPAFISLNNAYTKLFFFRSPFDIIYEKIKNINDIEFKPNEINMKRN